MNQDQIAEMHKNSITPKGYINEPNLTDRRIRKMYKNIQRERQEYENQSSQEVSLEEERRMAER